MRFCTFLFWVVISAWALGSPVLAQNQMRPGLTDGDFDPTAPPPAIKGLTVEQSLGATVPLDGALSDEHGQRITLRELLADGKPVILELGYYECPLLCPTVRQGIALAVGQASREIGEDYTIVSLSIDPEETPTVARAEQRKYLARPEFKDLDDPESAWRFLTGSEPSVKAIADAVGYGYRYLPGQDEYGHAAVIVFLSPEGTVSSYLFGTRFPGRQMDLAIGDASAGEQGSILQVALQWCYQFDASQGEYVLIAKNVMKLGGALVLLVVVTCIAGLFWWERRKKAGKLGAAAVVRRPGSAAAGL